jgi:hypothetical protein
VDVPVSISRTAVVDAQSRTVRGAAPRGGTRKRSYLGREREIRVI